MGTLGTSHWTVIGNTRVSLTMGTVGKQDDFVGF